MWPSELVLVRHAQSEGNVRSVEERTTYDVATHAYPLTELGRRQAAATGAYLHSEYGDFDTRYVSYYVRSRETMALMYPGAKVYEDPRLAEAQRGIYHTMTRGQIETNFPFELVRKEREGLYHYRPLGGENWPDVEMRIHSFLSTLARDYGGTRVIIVCHGHWLLLFQRLVERFSIDEALQRYHAGVVRNASITVYQSPTGERLVKTHENFVPDHLSVNKGLWV